MEDVKDILLEAGKDKAMLKEHVSSLLDVLVHKESMHDPAAYKVMAALVLLIQDDLLASHGEDVFSTIITMFDMSDTAAANNELFVKRTADEIANALFSNSCSALQSRYSSLTASFVPHILNAMKRNENARWAGYACIAPLLHGNINVFTNAVEPLLHMVPYFPREVLSVINELYQLQPRAFTENIPLLILICEGTPEAQVSILQIIYEIGRKNGDVIEPYLVKLRELCEQNDEASVAEMKAFFEERIRRAGGKSSSSSAPSPPSPILARHEEGEGGEDATLSGALRKRGRMFGRMVSRWFTLEDGNLNFFKSSNKAEPSRRLSMSDVVRVTSDTKHPHAFVVRTRKSSVLLSAGSDKEKEQWMSALEKHSKK